MNEIAKAMEPIGVREGDLPPENRVAELYKQDKLKLYNTENTTTDDDFMRGIKELQILEGKNMMPEEATALAPVVPNVEGSAPEDPSITKPLPDMNPEKVPFEQPEVARVEAINIGSWGMDESEFGRQQEMKVKEFAGDALEFVLRPFGAMGEFALAPIASREYESTSLMGKAAESFSIAGKAFMDALVPEFGQETPFYGKDITEQIMPNASEGIKNAVGMSIELIADPSVALGLGASKVVQKGLAVARNEAVAKGEKPFSGLMIEGVQEVFGAGRGFDLTTEIGRKAAKPEVTARQKKIIELAVKADQGDKNALQAFSKEIEKDDAMRASIELTENTDMDQYMANIESVLGDPNGGYYSVVNKMEDGSVPPPEAFQRSLTTNDQVQGFVPNTARLDSEADVDLMLQDVYAQNIGQYEALRKTQTNGETIDLAQNQLLSNLLGKKVTSMKPEEAYALRQVLVSSGENLHQLALKTESADATKMDYLAFEKALAVHQVIQGKATGAASHAGRLLQSYNIKAGSSRERLTELNSLLERLCY